MKVSDVMQRHVDFVSSDAKVLDVARIIFGRHINGVPVCEGKKIVGFIADTDILSKLHPTMREFAEDPLSSVNFESMEGKAAEVLELTAKDLMSSNPIVINVDEPLLKADSTMRLRDVGRLPVVDDKDNLVGIISMGDIFKALIGKKMPYLESEEYHDWIAKHFDLATGWESRIPSEIPCIVEIFQKKTVKRILDIGCGTGEHAINLAKKGFQVLGLEHSRVMFSTAQAKWKELPKNLQSQVKFIQGDYVESLKKAKDEYQAAIFMGNAMAHIPNTYKDVLTALNSMLSQKGSVIVSQLINFERAIKISDRLYRFTIQQSKLSPLWQHAYFWFFDPAPKKGDLLTLNAGILDFDGRRWITRGMNAVKTMAFAKEDLRKIFKEIGFSKTSFYGSKRSEILLKNKFNLKKHDWMTVVAERE